MHLKIFLTIIMFLSVHVLDAQPYILLDKKFSKPIIQKDSITDEDLNNGLFPVDKNNLDSLIIVLNNLQQVIDPKKEREVINMAEYDLSNISFTIQTIKRAYGDRYDITIISTGKGYKVAMLLCSSDFSNSFNKQKLHDMVSYIESNKKAWNEKFYTQ
jgi:hypothetical protein